MPGYPAFLSAVQNVANVSGVQLAAWSPGDEVAEQFYARVPMKLRLVGRYHQVAKFFYGVSQLDRIINLENVMLTKPEVRGEDVLIEVETLATAFRAVQDAGPVEAVGVPHALSCRQAKRQHAILELTGGLAVVVGFDAREGETVGRGSLSV